MEGRAPMRPRSIILFERLYLAAIAIEVGRVAIEWPLLLQASASDRWVRVAAIGVSLLLLLLTSRRRKRIAGIVLAALFVIGLPMISTVFQPGIALSNAAIVVVQIGLQAVALALLFTPGSRAWFDMKPAPDGTGSSA